MKQHELTKGALEMTFNILKKRHPSLALTVRNILEGSRDNRESFLITLSQQEIANVVSSIETDIEEISDLGMKVVATALLEDWKSMLS